MPRYVAIIEARMGSSRLPGKVLRDICGKPALGILVERLSHSQELDGVIVATSTAEQDDAIAAWCAAETVDCWRGSEDDVLSRVVGAAEFAGADVIVEITGDCPLTDPKVVDLAVTTHRINSCDVVTNCGNKLTWPMGIYAQVFSIEILKRVAETVFDPAVREHVSLYFYENEQEYNIIDLIAPLSVRKPQIRCQLDYLEDLIFLRKVISELKTTHGFTFDTHTLMSHLENNKDLLSINMNCLERHAR